VLNLLLNARDAIADTGRVTVRVARKELGPSVRPPARAGRFLLLSIEDTGSGMDGSVRARIFEPFFTTKAPGHGTGLGLSTAYGIVRQAGGFIDVHSVVGKGTRFEVYLPLAEEGALAPEPRP
jgi:two-component system cell cycle sensor histidine kinase/response regulator CckA